MQDSSPIWTSPQNVHKLLQYILPKFFANTGSSCSRAFESVYYPHPQTSSVELGPVVSQEGDGVSNSSSSDCNSSSGDCESEDRGDAGNELEDGIKRRAGEQLVVQNLKLLALKMRRYPRAARRPSSAPVTPVGSACISREEARGKAVDFNQLYSTTVGILQSHMTLFPPAQKRHSFALGDLTAYRSSNASGAPSTQASFCARSRMNSLAISVSGICRSSISENPEAIVQERVRA